jgi:hypothetical protein
MKPTKGDVFFHYIAAGSRLRGIEAVGRKFRFARKCLDAEKEWTGKSREIQRILSLVTK